MDNILEEIKRSLNPKSIAIFGSTVKGRDRETSDVDILVITKDIKKEKIEEIEKKYRKVDLHVFTPLEALEYSKNSPYFQKIIEEAKPVYGGYFIEILKEVARKWKKQRYS